MDTYIHQHARLGDMILCNGLIRHILESKNKNFKILNINNISSDTKMLWVICYEPVMGYNCNISRDKRKNWILNETKKLYLLNAQLYEIRN